MAGAGLATVESDRHPSFRRLISYYLTFVSDTEKMKKFLPVSLFVLLFVLPGRAKAQSTANTLDVIGWNLEFFGAPFASGPANKDLQEANAKKLWLLSEKLTGINFQLN